MTGPVENVEREIDKLMHKLKELSKHQEQTLSDLIQQIEVYQNDFTTLTCKLFLFFSKILFFNLIFFLFLGSPRK